MADTQTAPAIVSNSVHKTLKATLVIGTRPELIKMAPVVRELRRRRHEFDVRVLFTGQHRELLEQMDSYFQVGCDANLDLMEPGQSLSRLSARALTALDAEFKQHRPDVVLSQGDTTSVFIAALAAFYAKIPFAHVEAGLRTSDISEPFPEEANRRLAATLTDLHFAPTPRSAAHLLAEGAPPDRVFVTGNTGIDTLLAVLATGPKPPVFLRPDRKLCLVTVHRRENFGKALRNIFSSIRELARSRADIHFVYPVHPNPQVGGVAREFLEGLENVELIEPVGYEQFVALMQRASLIMTDSGGVQEEVPSLRVPVLVLRRETERPEGVACGAVHLVDPLEDDIFARAQELLKSEPGEPLSIGPSPYGDGRAALRIANILRDRFADKLRVSATESKVPFQTPSDQLGLMHQHSLDKASDSDAQLQ